MAKKSYKKKSKRGKRMKERSEKSPVKEESLQDLFLEGLENNKSRDITFDEVLSTASKWPETEYKEVDFTSNLPNVEDPYPCEECLPNGYVHHRICSNKRLLFSILYCFQALFPFRWWLDKFNWEPLEDGRWVVELVWIRKESVSYIIHTDSETGKTTKKGNFYPKVRLKRALQLLWFYIRSKKYDPKDEGTVQGETASPGEIKEGETFTCEGSYGPYGPPNDYPTNDEPREGSNSGDSQD